MVSRSLRTEVFSIASLPIFIITVLLVLPLNGGVASGLSDSDLQSGISLAELSGSDAHAKNVILMIGDGMGQAHIDAARWEEAGHNPAIYRSPLLAMDRLQYSGTVSTAAADSPITDSAAAVTALMTGVKTNTGVIGQDATAVYGVSDGVRLDTIAELAKASGRATGVVSTARITHATPAGAYAHINTRKNEPHIALQFLDSHLDVALGGGYSYFVDRSSWDPWGESGARIDGRNLVVEAQAEGYTVVTTKSLLSAVPATSGTKVLGLFNPDHMHYELWRAGTEEPSLAEMTGKATTLLAADPDGFFLMVEGGRIDGASAANNYPLMTGEVLAFDDAVQTALTFVSQHPDTLLVVTADHETGGLTHRENSDGTHSFSFSTTGHTGADVPIMASGPGADRVGNNRISNTQVFGVMRDSMNLVTPTPTYSVVTVPGGSAAPHDMNADGKYDDVNGNGRKDFADVVLYFNQMTWISANEPVTAFDFNGNGRVDFADVVQLFNNL